MSMRLFGSNAKCSSTIKSSEANITFKRASPPLEGECGLFLSRVLGGGCSDSSSCFVSLDFLLGEDISSFESLFRLDKDNFVAFQRPRAGLDVLLREVSEFVDDFQRPRAGLDVLLRDSEFMADFLINEGKLGLDLKREGDLYEAFSPMFSVEDFGNNG